MGWFLFFGWRLPPHLFRVGQSKQAAPGLPCNSSGRGVKEMGNVNWRTVFGRRYNMQLSMGAHEARPYPVGFPVGPWRDEFRFFHNATCSELGFLYFYLSLPENVKG